MYKMNYNIKKKTSNGVKIRVVILAAGKGTRMQSRAPKALLPFRGEPMIALLLRSVRESGVDLRPVIVVGYGADAVRAAAESSYEYVVQDEQRGTGHAVAVIPESIRKSADAFLVLYVDHPLIKPETIQKIAEMHRVEHPMITMATTTVPHFQKPYDAFAQFGRIVRNTKGNIEKIVEVVDASPEELKIREVNGAMYCFDSTWLWQHLPRLQENQHKKELFLTDLIALAVAEGARIATVAVADAREQVGVNTIEQLHDVEEWNI